MIVFHFDLSPIEWNDWILIARAGLSSSNFWYYAADNCESLQVNSFQAKEMIKAFQLISFLTWLVYHWNK